MIMAKDYKLMNLIKKISKDSEGKDEDECVVDGINEEWRIGVEL